MEKIGPIFSLHLPMTGVGRLVSMRRLREREESMMSQRHPTSTSWRKAGYFSPMPRSMRRPARRAEAPFFRGEIFGRRVGERFFKALFGMRIFRLGRCCLRIRVTILVIPTRFGHQVRLGMLGLEDRPMPLPRPEGNSMGFRSMLQAGLPKGLP